MAQNSTYALAREVAVRLERAGENPYADDSHQYLVLGDHREGEVLEFGRPLRAHRMFPMKTRAKTERLANDFAAFAETVDNRDWCFWTVHRPSRKTKLHELVADLREFNLRLNNVFTQLRKHCNFELLLLGVHIGFDETTGLFDIHSHFVGKIAPGEPREEARRRLMTAFSRADTPDGCLRSPQGAARYLSRTFRLDEVVRWPISALRSVWDLINHRFHYTRTAGAFANWRSANKAETNDQRLEEARSKRDNRKETSFSRGELAGRDIKLVSRVWNIQGEQVRGTLYRAASNPEEQPAVTHPKPAASPANDYPSAFVATTQTALPDQSTPAGETVLRAQITAHQSSKPGPDQAIAAQPDNTRIPNSLDGTPSALSDDQTPSTSRFETTCRRAGPIRKVWNGIVRFIRKMLRRGLAQPP